MFLIRRWSLLALPVLGVAAGRELGPAGAGPIAAVARPAPAWKNSSSFFNQALNFTHHHQFTIQHAINVTS